MYVVVDQDSVRLLAEDAASGALGPSEVAERVSRLACGAHLSGAAYLARVLLGLLPASLYVRRVFAWYASLYSGYRLLPVRCGEALDVAVDEIDASPGLRERLRVLHDEVVSRGPRGGVLLVACAVVRPCAPGVLGRVERAVRRALGRFCRGVSFVELPLPPEGELGELDV